MSALKTTQIGNSVGVILTKDVLARMRVSKGDTVYVMEVDQSPGAAPAAR
jgi:putative addiction module antidote